MLVTFVYVHVKEEYVDDFIQISRVNHQHSIKEPGNLRFDVLQQADDPTRFVFYEAYESEAAAAAHKNTPHYLKWKETVAEWMAEPRQGVKHLIISPTERNKW
jgi:autoinducer 2-degrading protein